MRTGRVRIKTMWGEARVRAEIAGPFAIHKTFYREPSARATCRTFALTHVPSGCAFGKTFATKSDARAVMRVIRKLMDWTEVKTQADVPDEVRRDVRNAMQAAGVWV